NVIVHQEQLFVIDFAYSGPAYRELDFVCFQHSLQRSIGYLPMSGAVRRMLWRRFLEGYQLQAGSDGSSLIDPLLRDLHQLRFLLDLTANAFDDDAWIAPRKLLQLYMLTRTRSLLRRWLRRRARAYGC